MGSLLGLLASQLTLQSVVKTSLHRDWDVTETGMSQQHAMVPAVHLFCWGEQGVSGGGARGAAGAGKQEGLCRGPDLAGDGCGNLTLVYHRLLCDPGNCPCK